MIFICFGGDERYSVVKNIIYHLENFNIKYWYDNHNLTLGDIKRKNIFNNGIDKSKYAIIIYSKTFHDHPSSVEEEKYLYKLFKNKKIRIFPILYNVSINELPEYTREVLENIIYNEIDDSSNLYLTINQIIIYLLKDKYKLNYHLKFQFTKKHINRINDNFIKKELSYLISMESTEINLKIMVIKLIFDYLLIVKKIIRNNDIEYLIFNYLINKINYKLTYNFKEIEILSLIVYYYSLFFINS